MVSSYKSCIYCGSLLLANKKYVFKDSFYNTGYRKFKHKQAPNLKSLSINPIVAWSDNIYLCSNSKCKSLNKRFDRAPNRIYNSIVRY